jgi:hypothetical protein
MGRQPKPWVADFIWAGFFLALFIYYRWHSNQTAPEPIWASFPEVPRVEFTEPQWSRDQKWERRPYEVQPSDRARAVVASDTVTDRWLRAQGWPQWKVDGFVRDRERWGGVDSALCARWDNRSEFDWILHPPSPLDLNSISEDCGGRRKCARCTGSVAGSARCATGMRCLLWLPSIPHKKHN